MRLAGCAETYVPWTENKWGLVMRGVTHPKRPFALRGFAYGVRHPTGMTASVYVIADRRLNPRALTPRPAVAWLPPARGPWNAALRCGDGSRTSRRG